MQAASDLPASSVHHASVMQMQMQMQINPSRCSTPRVIQTVLSHLAFSLPQIKRNKPQAASRITIQSSESTREEFAAGRK
jgi:hypothetical protein